MYSIATFLLIAGIAAGAGFGYLKGMPVLETVLYGAAGGFVGSVAGGLVFTYLYFTAPDDDPEESPALAGGQDHARLPEPEIKKLPDPVSNKERPAITDTTDQPPDHETPKDKIKRLEQEIQALKTNRRK